MHATDALAEADRLMTICNSCRYCEGLCAVFPAMEARRSFPDADLDYLANLCHGCGACYDDCQFAPPHEFAVNVPKTLAIVRRDSYATYAWPPHFADLFKYSGLTATLGGLLGVVGLTVSAGPAALFARRTGVSAFYDVISHRTMVLVFGAAFLTALLALTLSLRRFRRGGPAWTWPALRQAIGDAGRLRYLAGGGGGCRNEAERSPDRRRLYHHLTFYGFLLCFAATVVATLYHYLLGREAPYGWTEAPVILGALGGVGLIAGPLGLLAARLKRDPALIDAERRNLDISFTLTLLATSASGLALLLGRETSAMGSLLIFHLAIVFALFITMPYGKFIHGLYRFAALTRYARERQEGGISQ
ncbi:MAG: tricarballylate utilization 4Fe-4S protein TcuB [Aliidongia sp.]